MAYNTIICAISFCLLESFKITLLEDFILNIIKLKVTVKSKKKTFSATLASIIVMSRSSNKVISNDSDSTNRIVQMNGLY